MPIPPEDAKISHQYALRLGTALVILAAVYFGEHFIANQQPPAGSQKNDTKTASIAKDAFAATLPIAQDAYLSGASDAVYPIRNWDIAEPQLTAQSIYIFEIGSQKILLQKEPEQIQPIASLSKLMTALVVMDNSDLSHEALVSKNAIDTEGEMGHLVVGEKLTIENLLYAMLIESSNDAAVALAENYSGNDQISQASSTEEFVMLMNLKTQSLGLTNTHYSDPDGLSTENVSNAEDLTKIMQEFIKYPLLNSITKIQQIDISSTDGKFKSHLVNTDKLLAKYPEIIAGKTGYIDEAGNCMVIATKSPNDQSEIITVILNSKDRLGEMDKLLEWEKEGFVW